MSSRRVLLLAVAALLMGLALLAWGLTRWWWGWQPVGADVQQVRATVVLQAAAQMRAGARMETVEAEMGIDLRPEAGTEDGPSAGPPGMMGSEWERTETPGGSVWRREGPEHELAAWTGSQWVVLHEDAVPPGLGLLALLLLGMAPVLGGVWLLSARALRPVEAAEQAISWIERGHLDHRLDEDHGPPELRRMARAINALVSEAERLVDTERQRTAGLSHEMRTPLTRARLELELARRAGGDTERIDRVENELVRLDDLVAELLALARLEGSRRDVRREVVELHALVEALVDDEQLGPVDISGDGLANVDPRLVRRAVSNLLRNSAVHAPGSHRQVNVSDRCIVVSDDGPGLDDEAIQRVTEPFWRGPGASADGHGLGLAIVARIVTLHDGTLELSGNNGLSATLSFPDPELPEEA